MSFFDNKEEVIKIELTQYGKFLLSKGKFSPKFYSFHDDDVIYDSLYMNINENQNLIEDRILKNTPISKPQAVFSSVQDSILESTENLVAANIEDVNLKQIIYQTNNDINDSFLMPLGKCSQNTSYAPAWQINPKNGSINFISQYMTSEDGNKNSFIRIPQINMKTGSFNIKVYENQEPTPDSESLIFNNNYLKITSYNNQIPILFEILEKNTVDEKENFEIEVFKEEIKTLTNGKQKKIWNKLSFFKKPTDIKNNILLDDEIYKEVSTKIADTSNVEYYFEFLLDDEIEGLATVDNKKRAVVVYGTDDGTGNAGGSGTDPNGNTGDEC